MYHPSDTEATLKAIATYRCCRCRANIPLEMTKCKECGYPYFGIMGKKLSGSCFDREHFLNKREKSEIITEYYKAMRCSSECLQLIRLAKGMVLLRLHDSVGLPTWTARKANYYPWRLAEALMLPEYNIEYDDLRRIGRIETNRMVCIFLARKGFHPEFKRYYSQLGNARRDTIESVAVQVEALLKSRDGWFDWHKGPDDEQFKDVVQRMLVVIERQGKPPKPKMGW